MDPIRISAPAEAKGSAIACFRRDQHGNFEMVEDSDR